jgi:hypothetical protein
MYAGLAVAIAGAAQAATQQQGTLVGVVTRGPITPVCVAEQPCDEPAAHVTLVFSRGGRDSARVTTSGKGRYRVRLAPGTYSVRRARFASVDARLTPHLARVTGGRQLRIDFSIDTGIR